MANRKQRERQKLTENTSQRLLLKKNISSFFSSKCSIVLFLEFRRRARVVVVTTLTTAMTNTTTTTATISTTTVKLVRVESLSLSSARVCTVVVAMTLPWRPLVFASRSEDVRFRVQGFG